MGDADDATEHDVTGRGATHEAADVEATDVEATDGATTQAGPTEVDRAEAATTPLGDEVMDLLAEHVPLALLADLAAPSDQVSTEILESEGLPDDAWWETPQAEEATPEHGGQRPSDEQPDGDDGTPATA